MRALDMSLCRRNGQAGLSGMAIADITLLSGFSALRADLEKVRSAALGGGDPLCRWEPSSIPKAVPATEPCLVQGPGPPPCHHLSFPTAGLPL